MYRKKYKKGIKKKKLCQGVICYKYSAGRLKRKKVKKIQNNLDNRLEQKSRKKV